MKKNNYKLYLILFLFTFFINAEEQVDIINIYKKEMGIEKIDLEQMNFETILMEENPIKKDIRQNWAELYVLSESIINQYPREYDQKDFIRYNGKILSKDLLKKSKKYFMKIIDSDVNEDIKILAFLGPTRVFTLDEEVINWLANKIFTEKISSNIYASALNALRDCCGEKYKNISDLAIITGLSNPVQKLRKNPLKIIALNNDYRDVFIPGLLQCFITTTDSSRTIRDLEEILKKYNKNIFLEYKSVLKNIYNDNPNRKYMKSFIDWLEGNSNTKTQIDKITQGETMVGECIYGPTINGIK